MIEIRYRPEDDQLTVFIDANDTHYTHIDDSACQLDVLICEGEAIGFIIQSLVFFTDYTPLCEWFGLEVLDLVAIAQTDFHRVGAWGNPASRSYKSLPVV